MPAMLLAKSFSVLTAAAVAAGSLPVVQAGTKQTVSLNIEKVEITADALPEDRTVDVNLRIDGNDEGFLAAEFGITYDARLTLSGVAQETSPGNLFRYADNPDSNYIWFSGASASKTDSACKGRQPMVTMQFTLPEDYSVGDSYYIGYAWIGLDNKNAYWYTDKGSDQIQQLSGYSITGSITIPDPSAPRLAKSEIRLNRGDTAQVALLNYDGTPLWYSDNGQIADVDNDGIITGYYPGTCTINCIAGTAFLTCEVTVTEEYYYSIIGDSPITLTDPASEVYLEYPDALSMVVWRSTRPDIVDVVDGRLTGVRNGSAQIIATCNSVTYVRQVVVNFPELTTEVETDATLPTETMEYTDIAPVTDHHEPVTGSPDDRKCGDLTGDGKVNILDVITLNKNLLVGEPLDAASQKAADALRDGKLDAKDSLTILKYTVGLVTTLPVVP